MTFLKNEIFLWLKLKSMGSKLKRSGSKEEIPLSCSGEKFNICGRQHGGSKKQKYGLQNQRNTCYRIIKI